MIIENSRAADTAKKSKGFARNCAKHGTCGPCNFCRIDPASVYSALVFCDACAIIFRASISRFRNLLLDCTTPSSLFNRLPVIIVTIEPFPRGCGCCWLSFPLLKRKIIYRPARASSLLTREARSFVSYLLRARFDIEWLVLVTYILYRGTKRERRGAAGVRSGQAHEKVNRSYE